MVTYCKQRNESKEEQNNLENYIFSDQYNSDEVVQDVDDPRMIHINRYNFMIIDQIGSGSNGKVYSLRDNTNNVFLAIKFSINDTEVSIANELNAKIPSCNVLRVKSIGKSLFNPIQNKVEEHGYFMELAEGTLQDFLLLIKDVDPEILLYEDIYVELLLGIAENIRQQMICIYEMNNNYVYTDLKSLNVLYKCNDTSNLDLTTFILGDLGSAVPNSEHKLYLSTYPPIEFSDKNGYLTFSTNQEKESAMAWQIGVLLLFFVAGNRYEYNMLCFNNIQYISESQMISLYTIMVRMYGADIANLLNTNVALRRSIYLPLVG
jgi:serine/threonine protein kinase